MKINYKVKESDPETIAKYRLKMFRKRRKNLTFTAGQKVRYEMNNIEYVCKSQKNTANYYMTHDIGQETSSTGDIVFKKVPDYLTVQMVGSTQIKVAEFTYWHRKEMFEAYEDKISNPEG